MNAFYMSHDGRHVFHADHVEHPESFRPVVVIDPEDREQVEQLIAAWFARRYPMFSRNLQPHEVDDLQAALRAVANPTPPKPPEPESLGAVVKDAEGLTWVRVEPFPAGSTPWVASWTGRDDDPQPAYYDDIDAVEVVRP